MKNLKMNLVAPLLFATLAVGLVNAAGAATSNGFANGGFETANSAANPPGDATYFAQGWLAAPTGNPAMWSTDAHSGSHSALLTNPNGFGGSTLFQNSMDHGGLLALDAANIGTSPSLSFWAKGDVSETGNVLFALRYLSADGSILGTSGNQFFQNSLSTSNWSQITYQGGVIPAGTVALFLEMNTAVGPLLSNRQNAVLIDDINLSVIAAAVPEPQTYALMLAGLGILGAAARRRRA
ncbi:PEPxxWA-CTERM sorting domain-containing protein [Roseateles oligotrophus]|uniref:PEPxxWA-CTERM sorting domain-containing protein n=1 Tax=Roseateles oligotrophus TaxID=1769250 RepID=A0ABT2Y8L4_9BURK|nr:PEPxxWA-CTERM sorting domain-containing protein [Roseateles oligotrophus]MCV2366628.1 PEPxxWA-CTERM sorting domain-containing protein [Roseateles oligotrophus]